jgi:hypothetical protein
MPTASAGPTSAIKPSLLFFRGVHERTPPYPPSNQIDQRGQTIQGPQTNVAGDQHIHYHSDAPPQPRARYDFYQQEHLPPNYVARPELLAELRDALLQTSDNIALTSSLRQADALFGMGGIGKTVMARALCDDEAIQAAFPHGILWATLGQTPDLTARLRDWIYALGSAVPPTALTPDALTNLLTQTLSGRRCLFIVDDVWQRAHLKYFLAAAQGCRLLFTTRNADIATEVKAAIRPVPVMARDEAIALLIEWAGESIIDTPRSLQEAIVERLGRLPLAIKLAGDQLRRHEPATWLANFDAHKLAKRRPQDPHDSLETTFALSLADLTAEERRLFNALAIFPDDELIPLCAIAKLWAALAQYAVAETVDLLHFLADRALLQLASAPHLPQTTRYTQVTVTFHDLIRDFMAAELGEEGLHTNHLALLAAYRQTQRDAGWPSAPDDGYFYDHLVYHLAAIAPQEPGTLSELLTLFASPAWLHTRVPADDYRYDGYLRDLSKTWAIYRSNSHTATAADLAQTLPTHTRFALLRTSITSLAGNYSPALVGYAVALGLWPKTRALSIFLQTTDPLHKAQVGCALLAMGHLTQKEQATVLRYSLAAANAIVAFDKRLRTLIALVHHQPAEERMEILHNLLRLTATLPTPWQQVQAFAEFASLLHSQHHPAVLDWINKLTTIHYQMEAAMQLLMNTTKVSLETREVIGTLFTNDDKNSQFTAIFYRMTTRWPIHSERYGIILQTYFETATPEQAEALLQKLVALLNLSLSESFLQQAYKATLAIQDEEQRATLLGVLVCYLSLDQQKQLFQQILAAVFAIPDERSQTQVLDVIAAQISNNPTVLSYWRALFAMQSNLLAHILNFFTPSTYLRNEQLEGALLHTGMVDSTSEDREEQAKGLFEPAPYFHSEQLLQQALAMTSIITDEWERTEVLRTLAPHLQGEQILQQTLAIVSTIKNERRRAEVLRILAPHLQSEQLLQQALTIVNAIEHEELWTNVLLELALHLQSEQLMQQALTMVNTIEYERQRTQILRTLAPHLQSEQLLQQALTITSAITDEWERTEVLRTLAPHLHSEQLVRQALTIVDAIKNRWKRADLQCILVPYLGGQQQEKILHQVLAIASATTDEWERAEILHTFAPHLHGEQTLQQALTIASTIKNERQQAEVLRTLASHATGQQQEKILKQVLTSTSTIKNEEERAEVLLTLVAHLQSEQLMQQALTMVNTIEYEELWSEVLLALAPHLHSEHALQQALIIASAIRDEELWSEALFALAPHFQGEQTMQQALTIASAIKIERRQVEVLLKFTLHSSSQQQEQILQQALTIAGNIKDEEKRTEVLLELAPHLQSEQTLQQALVIASAIKDEWERVEVLHTLAPHLHSEYLLQQAFTMLNTIKDAEEQAKVLLALAPYLHREYLLQQALAIVSAIKDETRQAKVLLALALHSDGQQQEQILQQVLTTTNTIKDEDERAEVLCTLAPHFIGQQRKKVLQQALTTASTIENQRKQTEVLCKLVPYFSGQQREQILQQVLTTTSTIENERGRKEILLKLAPYLHREQTLQQALAIASTIKNEHDQVQILVRFAPCLSSIQQGQLFQQMLSTALATEESRNRTDAVQLLIPHLHSEVKGGALIHFLKTNLALTAPTTRIDVLLRLLPYITELPPLHYCLILLSLEDEWLRAELIDRTLLSLSVDAHTTVADILPNLADPLNRAKIATLLTAQPTIATVETQLQTAVAISDEQQRLKLYLTLRNALSSQQQPTVNPILTQTLSHLREPTNIATAQLFLSTTPNRTERASVLTRLLRFADAVTDLSERIANLIALLPDLEPAEQAAVIEHALGAAQRINTPQLRVSAFLLLLPWLAGHLRAVTARQLYQDAFTIPDPATRTRSFTTLYPYLDDNLRPLAIQRAITAAQQIANPLDHVALLAQIAATGDRRAIELTQAALSALTDHSAIALAIPLLLPVVNEVEKVTLLHKGLQSAWALPSSTERTTTLASYLPYVTDPASIHKELLLTIIDTIYTYAQSATRATMLDYLATDPLLQKVQLPTEIIHKLIDTVAEITNEWKWL